MIQHRRLQQQRVMIDLAALSPDMIPYVTAAAMASCEFFTAPALPLLEVLTEWICSHAALFWKPYKDALKFARSASSVSFLKSLSQSLGKLLCLCLAQPASTQTESLLYDRLELGLLSLIEMAPKSKSKDEEDTHGIVTTRVVTDTMKYIQQHNPKDMQKASYALFRVLQTTVSYGCFAGSKRELEQALAPYLSDYPFLQFVVNQ